MQLYATKGCGSAIVEMVFAIAGVKYERIEVDYDSDAGRAILRPLNPLAQVPTLVMPDGDVMTESAAIALYIDETVPTAQLAPPIGDPQRRDFLRWLTFIVAAIYPTFTYGDSPAKWGLDAKLKTATDAHREGLWRYLETIVDGPWFLGARFSVLDLYIAAMSHWRPRRAWFAANCPTLYGIALAVEKDARVAPVLAANFG